MSIARVFPTPLVLSLVLLSACSPSEKEEKLAALKAWNPQVPALEKAEPVAAASSSPPVKTFADVPTAIVPVAPSPTVPKGSEPVREEAKPNPPLTVQRPSTVQVKVFQPKALPRQDTCEALPLLQQLPKSTAWYEVSDYNAGFAEGVQFLPDSTHVMRIAKIRVSHPGPVALLLGAYEPNVWQIETAPGTTVVGVWASGYHAQRVTGVPGTTPVVISSYEGKGPCGYAYQNLGKAYSPKLGVLSVTPVPISKGVAYVGDPAPVYKPFANSPVPSDFTAKDELQPHSYGIGQLVARGALRRASEQDRKTLPAWMRDYPETIYMVQKATQLPRGMYGANGGGTIFVVPPGVPEPTGDLGHARLYNLKTNTCRTGVGECR